MTADTRRRGRGRPRKTQVDACNPRRPVGRPPKAKPFASQAEPIKRPRGRPRKAAATAEVLPKRPVGRPRKHLVAAVAGPKRPVGRPRKNAAPQTVAHDSKAQGYGTRRTPSGESHHPPFVRTPEQCMQGNSRSRECDPNNTVCRSHAAVGASQQPRPGVCCSHPGQALQAPPVLGHRVSPAPSGR